MTDQLKSLAARIERLMDERDGLGADIRDIFTEAKSAGYVPKVLRKAITRKRMDPSKRDEEDAILELYEGALGAVGKAVAAVRAGATWKEAAADHGVPRATLARAVKVSKSRTDTANEITKTALDTPCESAGTPEVTSRAGSALAAPTHEMGAEHGNNSDAAPEGCVKGPSVFPPAETIVPPRQDPQADEAAPLSVTPVPDEGVGAGTIPTREGEREGEGETGSATRSGGGLSDALSPIAAGSPDACSTGDDGLDIPSFLRRVVVAPSKTPEQLDERVEGAAQ